MLNNLKISFEVWDLMRIGCPRERLQRKSFWIAERSAANQKIAAESATLVVTPKWKFCKNENLSVTENRV